MHFKLWTADGQVLYFFFLFFSLHEVKKQIFFSFFPHRFLRSVTLNIRKGQDPFVTSLLGMGECPGELPLCQPCATSAGEQQHRGAEGWCPHRAACPRALSFDICSFQVWAGRCWCWELGRNPWLASPARALCSLEGWKVSRFSLSRGDTVSLNSAPNSVWKVDDTNVAWLLLHLLL